MLKQKNVADGLQPAVVHSTHLQAQEGVVRVHIGVPLQLQDQGEKRKEKRGCVESHTGLSSDGRRWFVQQPPPSRRPPSARVLAHRPQLRTGGILPRASLALQAEGEPALFVVSQQPQPAVGLPALPTLFRGDKPILSSCK